MKQKSLLKTMLLLFALIAGSSSVWATELTASFTVTGLSSVPASFASSPTGFTMIVAANGGTNPAQNSGSLRLYCGNQMTISSSDGTTKFKSVTFNMTINAKSGKFPLITAPSGSFSPEITSNSPTSTTWTAPTGGVTTITFTFPENGQGVGGNWTFSGVSVAYESSAPYITASNVNIASDATNGSIAYTIGNSVTGGELTAALTEASDWLTVGAVNASSVAFTSTANTGTARSATVRLTYTYDTDKTVTKDVTVTQAKKVVNYTYNLANAVIPGRHYIIASGTNGSVKAMGAQNGNYRDEVGVTASEGSITVSNDAGVSEVLIQANEAKGYYTLLDVENNQYLYASSNSSNNLGIEATLDNKDNGIWSIVIDEGVATIKAKGANSRNWIRYNSSNTRFSCYASGQNNVYLFEKAGDVGSQTVSVSIAEACTDGNKYYATYSSPFGFVIPEGLTVEEIGIDNEGKLDVQAYAAGVRVPANTGVLISSSTAGSKTLTLAGGGTSVMDTDNRLRATGNGIDAEAMAAADASCKYYRLTMHKGTTLGFYWGAADGAAFALGANKAYLAVPSTSAPAFFEFGNTTGINEVRGQMEEVRGEYYNLAGQRVAQPTKGLYIVNGKKVIIK